MKYIVLFFTFFLTIKGFSYSDTTWKQVDLRGLTSSTNKGIHLVRFVKIDTIGSRQRWIYEIKTNSKYSISHTVFGIDSCVGIHSISNNTQTVLNPINQPQPPTYSNGIKADWGIAANTTATIIITTQGFFEGELRPIYLKSGQVSNFTNLYLPKCNSYYLSLTDVDAAVSPDNRFITFQFNKNINDGVNVYDATNKHLAHTFDFSLQIPHTSKGYVVVSGTDVFRVVNIPPPLRKQLYLYYNDLGQITSFELK